MKLRNKYTWLSVVFFASIAGSVGACSSSDNNGNPGDKDGGPGQDGGGTNDGGGGEETPNGKTGSVSVINSSFQGTPFYSVSAGFTDASALISGESGKCETSTEGACTVIKCPTPVVSDAGTPKQVSAGTIEISGADISPAFKLEADSDNKYEGENGSKSLWKGGEDITIKASGDASGVGSFEKTLKAAPPITVSGASQTIDRTKPLELTWTFAGSAAGDIAVALTTTGNAGSVSVSCAAPIADKKITVPAAALGQLPKGAGFFATAAGSLNTIKVSDYTVRLTTVSSATGKNGQPLPSQVTYE
ncbi:hypothetical protein LVJ94_22910 [Pendulispora rubella]|uniref:Lipoprotein n=1 Tax=Pendulispora rubella TaxID=2741070 RepID=A0ABZ2LLM8_9BACT